MSPGNKFQRILLKVSGEALMGDNDYGIDSDTVNRIAGDIAEVHRRGIQVCVVLAAAIYFAASPARLQVWNAPAPIMLACWPP